ncbi:MAG: CSLREA domain-containing protein, partial [Candidatus Limnocylindrales bacterium]
MRRRNAFSSDGRSSRFLIAIAITAFIGVLPLSGVGASSDATAPTAPGTTGTVDAAARPAASNNAASKPAAPPNPDQVPLVAVAGAGTGARLVISAPKQVAVGQTITIALKAIGVKNLAGYEGVLRFDSAAAEFDGLAQHSIALAGHGRDVESLGPVVIESGVAFGLYSCSLAGCGGTQSSATHAGASGSVTLAKLTLVPTAAGRLEIALGAMRFVDASGKLMNLALPRTISVQVGSGSTAYAAPAAPALRPGTAHPVTSADISGDGFVGPADLNEAAIAWGLARESGQSCGLVNQPADVNHDGCLDVQDLQLIAARVAPRPAPLAGHLAEPLVALDLTVNSTSDAPDANPGDGVCATAGAVCSLRAAITEANLHAGRDTILFDIPGGGVHTITLGSTLPIISDTTGGVTIDGYSQPGASVNTDPVIDNAQLMIQLTSASNPNLDGIFVSSADNVIRGISMYNFHRSISFETTSAHDNSLIGSFIGTNAAGTYFSPAFVSGGNGVNVTTGASYTTVGGTDPASRDVITGNSANGFSTYDEQTDHNVVYGDLIGLAPNGQSIRTCSVQCYGNTSHGVDINNGSSYNLIGGTGSGQRNVISNNRGEGIEFSHGSTTDSNQAVGNYIGTDVTGNAGAANKFGNGLNGVHLQDQVTNDTVAFNVVVNNGQRADGSEVMGGIGVEGFYAAGASIHDNMIGVGRDGVTPLPNKFFGVNIHFNASWMTVGPNNVIANNPSGVIVSDATDVFNTISHNSMYNNGAGKTGRCIQLLNHSNQSIAPPVL